MTSETTMKAWQVDKFGGKITDNMFLNNTATRPVKSLAPDEILVQVLSSALNPVDYKIAESSITRYAFGLKLPASPGLDYSGRVVASGNAIDTLTNGQLVFGRLDAPSSFGTLGDYILVTAKGCVPIPSGVELDHAASIGTAGLTAYAAVVPYVQKGSRVFINGGSGGVGIFLIQIAKVLGCHVTVSCSGANAELCKSLGADEVIDYKVSDVPEKLKSQGVMYDHIVDNVGTPENLYIESTHFLQSSGLFIQVAGDVSMMGKIASRMFKPSFLGGGTRRFKFMTPTNEADTFTQIGEWMKEGKVKAVIDSTYEFKDAPKAFEKLKTSRAKGKIIVKH